MGTVIRVATPDDIESIFDIRTAVVQNHLSREQMAELGITPQVVADSMRAVCVAVPREPRAGPSLDGGGRGGTV